MSFKRPKYHLSLIFLFSMLVLQGMNGYGQAPVRTYLKGQKTGNKTPVDAISLSTGSAGLSAPIQEHTHTEYLILVPYTVFDFYYGTTTMLTDSPVEYTTVRAAQDLGLAGLLGAGGNAYIQFRNTNNANLGSGTTTYFTLGGMPTTEGLSLDVGGLLGLSEEITISGDGYSPAGNYTRGSGAGNANEGIKAGTATSRIIIDQAGAYYAAVTPNAQHNSVRLNVKLPASLRIAGIARNLEARVYNAFTETSGGTCSVLGRYTSPPEVGGIALNTGVLGLNTGQLIANPHHALNMNDAEYASYSSGLLSLGVANTISQTIFFDHKAGAGDSFYAKIGLVNSLVGLDLLQLQGIKFAAFDGETQVWTSDLTSIANLLGLDLLNLINLGGTHRGLEIIARPDVAFDRIRISFDPGLLNLGVLGDAFRVYNIKLMPSAPTITKPNGQPLDDEICMSEGTSFQVQATVSGSGNITGYLWQYHNGTTWVPAEGTNNQATYNLTNVPLNYDGRRYRVRVTGGATGCTSSIYSNDALLTVLPKAGKPALTISN